MKRGSKKRRERERKRRRLMKEMLERLDAPAPPKNEGVSDVHWDFVPGKGWQLTYKPY